MSSNRRGSQGAPHVRADGVETRAVTVHLPVELAKRLRLEAAELGVSASRLMEHRLATPAPESAAIVIRDGGIEARHKPGHKVDEVAGEHWYVTGATPAQNAYGKTAFYLPVDIVSAMSEALRLRAKVPK